KEPKVKVEFGSEHADEKLQADTRTRQKFKARPHKFVEWRPEYLSVASTAGESVNAKLKGAGLMSFAFEYEQQRAADRLLRLEADYSQFTFKPDPPGSFPQQGSLKWADYSLTAAFHTTTSHFGFGFLVMHTDQIKRGSAQNIVLKDSFAGGVV